MEGPCRCVVDGNPILACGTFLHTRMCKSITWEPDTKLTLIQKLVVNSQNMVLSARC